MIQYYRPILVYLHWLMAIMITIVYVSMEFITLFPKGTTGRTVMLTTHYLLGLAILIFAMVRIWMWWRSEPVKKEPQGRFQQSIARIVFTLLYALMIIVPILGWVDVGLWDVSVSIGRWQLPQIALPDKMLAEEVSQIHILMAKTGYGLIALHGCAALYHHFILKDATLKRMLPRK